MKFLWHLAGLYEFSKLVNASLNTVKFDPQVQALKSIGLNIKFMGCQYAVDHLFTILCPSQTGLWVTDTISLLEDSNCKDNCPSNTNDFNPNLTYL